VRSVTDLMMMPGMINLDFADVRTVMEAMGRAMMGQGEASGDRRALDAAEAAIANPLLEETSMKGAKGVLINITGGSDITLFEVDEAANRIREEVENEDAHIIFGSAFDQNMEGKIRVSVVATGIESIAGIQPRPMPVRHETRSIGRRIPEIRSAAPTTRSPVSTPVQASFGSFGFGGATLAPATGTMDLQAEEKALMEMTAAVRAAPVVAEEPAPEMELVAVAPAPLAPAPMPAQMAAVAEAVSRAPSPMPRSPAVTPERLRDIFMPKPVETKAPEPVMAAPEVPMEAPQPAARPEPSRVSLFGKYRSMTSRPKVEEAVRAPEPMKVERQAPALNISVGPQDRPMSSHDENELEIPAFLRRQAN
jgi:cell division protein FtsZ